MKLKHIKRRKSAWQDKIAGLISAVILMSPVLSAKAADIQGPSIPSPKQTLIIAAFGIFGLLIAGFIIIRLVKVFRKPREQAAGK